MQDHYSAFLTYSHDDQQLADQLSKRIRRYRAPKASGLRDKRLTVFRDVERLTAGTDLSEALRERLKVSEKLVLLSSPSSAASRYVNLEVETFLNSKPFEAIIIVLCRGELEASLPPRLKSIETEPLFIDLRNADRKRFRLESLRLIAAIHGVEYADLRRVDEAARRHRRNGLILAAVVSLFLIASGYLITTTEPETWARVRQPSPRQEIMPVHAFAVNRKDPSILLYKGQDARWGSNPRPEGYSLKPNRRIADFQRRATQHLKTHLGSETLATLRFELESRHRTGSGLIAVHGIFDWEKKQLRYFRSLTYAGETAAGERKQLSIPPSLESVSDDPFDLSPWPMEMLKAEALVDDWTGIRGTITDAMSDEQIAVEFVHEHKDEGYDEWVAIWDPEHVIFSNVDLAGIVINGEILEGLEHEYDLWQQIIDNKEWASYRKPGRNGVGGAYEGVEREDLLKIVEAIPDVTDGEALIQQLLPLLKRAEITTVTLISSGAEKRRADVLEVTGFTDSPELREEATQGWLFRGSSSASWRPLRLAAGEEQMRIIDVLSLDASGRQALILTEQHGFFRTVDGGRSWTQANFGEAAMRNGERVKTIVAGSAPVIYALVDRNRAYTDGENPLFRYKYRGWLARWRAGLVRLLQ